MVRGRPPTIYADHGDAFGVEGLDEVLLVVKELEVFYAPDAFGVGHLAQENHSALAWCWDFTFRVMFAMSSLVKSMSTSAKEMRSFSKHLLHGLHRRRTSGGVVLGVLFPCQVPVQPPLRAFRLLAVGPVTRIALFLRWAG